MTDRERCVMALTRAGELGCTAFEIDALYGWESRSGSRAGKRLSELLREKPPRARRLNEQRGKAHIHVAPWHVNGRETA